MKPQTCAYCNRPSFTRDATNPTLREQHLDLIALAASINRLRRIVTVSSLERALAALPPEKRLILSFGPNDIPALLTEMRDSGRPTPPSWLNAAYVVRHTGSLRGTGSPAEANREF